MLKNNIKQITLSFLLIIALFFATFNQLNVQANTEDNQYNYQGDGYEVTLEVTSQWDDTWNGLITIENTTDKPIRNWYVKFKMSNEITDIWNGEIVEHSDDTYVIKNELWNHDIKSGEKVEFGFTATSNNEEIDIPEDFSIPTKEMNVSEEDYEIKYTTKDQWSTGFTGEIELKNISNKVIEDWSIQFKTADNNNLTFDNADVISSDNELYEIHNTFSNMHLLPEQTVRIEVMGEKDDNHTKPILKQFELIQIGYDSSEIVSEEESVELVDLGETFFKQIQSDEDVLLNEENGLYYITNQLLISGVLADNYETIEKLTHEVGASIVGYIELTNDYQIEFDTDQEYNELEKMIDHLSSFSFIEDVSLNTVMIEEDELTETNDAEYALEEWDEANPSGKNWGAEAINALSAWDYQSDMQTVKIGVIDSSFYEDHEDLNFVQIWNNNRDINKTHGNHVAGIMAAGFNNQKGIAGISPNNQLYGYATKAGDNASEMNFTTVMEYKYAFALMIGNNVKVINFSRSNGDVQGFAASRGNTNAIQYMDSNAQIMEGFLSKLIIKGYDFLIVTAGGNGENNNYVIDNAATYGYEEFDKDRHSSNNKVSGNVKAFYNSFLNAISSSSVNNRIITVGSFGHEVDSSDQTSYHYSNFSNIGDRINVIAPGEEIHSTIDLTSNGQSKYESKKGTSMAAPYVSGVAAMIYGVNPALGGFQVKNILSSMNSVTVTDAHGNSYPVLDALASVEKAKDRFGETPPVAPPTGVLMGRVIDHDDDIVNEADVTIYRTTTGDSNLEDYSSSIKTDENGNFEFVLAEGSYNLIIHKRGYFPVVVNNISIVPDSVEYLQNTILVDGVFDTFLSSVKGNVSDALTGNGISNVTIKYRKGWNTQEGDYVKNILGVYSTTTDVSGDFDVDLPIGNYTAELSRDGFVTGYYNVFSSHANDDYNLVLTPVLSEDEYRIVLTWGSTPRDLDSHLIGTLDSEQLFHVYYGNREYRVDGEKMAVLDLDDTNGYGPETITMTVQADMVEQGVYTYLVHDYTNRNKPTSNQLSMSGANVKLYKGNNLLKTFNAPVNVEGNQWTVFAIENGNLKW